ncbi:MAG: glutamine-hydrolyzing carbamoyl-phosphate synthase small subunit [Coxiellaceae bacterium]|nr:glutamine-hydrolyzing carbamoyl-phosphate synthase small subunit [Coxiellaceae bacterium]
MSIEDQLRNFTPALLVLAEGSIFSGVSIGAEGETVGEVVFNTAITGYQEILTDPSYAEQIVTLTYPHIGNTGINREDVESDRVHAAGLIIRECSPIVSNWRATESLPDYLKRNKIVAIANIDTRRLTHILRDKGAQSGCIMTGKIHPEIALQKAKSFLGLNGKDLAIKVTREKISDCDCDCDCDCDSNKHIVVYDFGVKENIIRALKDRFCRVTIVPANTSVEVVLKLKPDGIVLSNGPGDPAACDYAIENTKILLTKKIPIFGICLGHQILGLALGAKTQKMKFGHHGANHPVQDVRTKKVFITSQNHGFCVDEKTLPDDVEVTHISLFDHSLQGFKHKTLPVMAFQGHPEAGPGPNDMLGLFDEFLKL